MSNKTIGIKQADGSFYPILQDGQAESKRLEVTTVRDGQTAIKINLYRKDTDSLDEPEYVDTLLIEDIMPHSKREPTINLSLKLDENNMLTATVHDPETGKSSDTSVSMLNLPQTHIMEPSDLDITDTLPEVDDELFNDDVEGLLDVTDTESLIPDDDFALPEDSGNFALPDLDAEDVPMADTSAEAEKGGTDFDPGDFEVPDIEGEIPDSLNDDFDIPEFNDMQAAGSDMQTEADKGLLDGTDTESLIPDDDFALPEDSGDFALPDLDAEAVPSAGTSAEAEKGGTDFDPGDFEVPDIEGEIPDSLNDDFDIPEFNDMQAAGSDMQTEADKGLLDGTDTESLIPDDDFALPEDSGDFELPDLDATLQEKTEEPSFNMEKQTDPLAAPDFNTDELDFDIPVTENDPMPPPAAQMTEKENGTDFNTDDFDIPDIEENMSAGTDEGFDSSGFDNTDTQFADGMDSGNFISSSSMPPLYDPDLPDEIDETKGERKYRAALIICIICALLCILAVIAIFLFFPWKKDVKTAQTNIVTVEPPQHMQPDMHAQTPPAPEENTIVVMDKETVEKREVVPEKTVPAPESKPRTVRHRVKWGDTLWDLSDTYYRNPWLYPIIAEENKIKNPDLILAGTYLTIPPR